MEWPQCIENAYIDRKKVTQIGVNAGNISAIRSTDSVVQEVAMRLDFFFS